MINVVRLPIEHHLDTSVGLSVVMCGRGAGRGFGGTLGVGVDSGGVAGGERLLGGLIHP